MADRPAWAAFDLADVDAEARAAGKPWHEFLRVPDLYVGLYRIRAGEQDRQSPHDADEVYHVMSGRGSFLVGEERTAVGPGSVLYVARGEMHRFVDVEEDLHVLVFFATG